ELAAGRLLADANHVGAAVVVALFCDLHEAVVVWVLLDGPSDAWVELVDPLAPLLEQERHAGSGALVAQRPHPVRVHRASVRAALTTGDDPVDRPLRPPDAGAVEPAPILDPGRHEALQVSGEV